jgi:hypothetical protein
MEKTFFAQPVRKAILIAAISLIYSGCEKRPETAQGVASPAEQTRPSVEIQPAAVSAEPAIVGREEGSFASYIHFPKDPAAAKMEGVVQFYCDVSANGRTETTYAVVGANEALRTAVQSALDWGRFKPASVDGKPKAVYLGGTVLFMHQDRQPVIVVSLATAERERVGKLTNYIQPQLIGGLGERLQHANSSLLWNRPWSGAAEVLFQISERGETQSSSIISENPKESGLGDLLQTITKDAQWIPAHANGKPTTGQINIVGNFGQY